MTSKEALEVITTLVEEYSPVKLIRHSKDYKTLNDLVEKDTPKKVNKSVEWNYKCSNCKEYINRDYGENEYCSNCGQKLKW